MKQNWLPTLVNKPSNIDKAMECQLLHRYLLNGEKRKQPDFTEKEHRVEKCEHGSYNRTLSGDIC